MHIPNKEDENLVISPDTPAIRSAGVCRTQDRVAAARGHWLSPSTTLLSKLLIDSTVRARLLLRLLFNPISVVHLVIDVPLVIRLRIILIRSPANQILFYSWLISFIPTMQRIQLWCHATKNMLLLKKNYEHHVIFLHVKSWKDYIWRNPDSN